MKITEQEFEEIEHAVEVAMNEGQVDTSLVYPSLEKMREVYKRYCWFAEEVQALDKETNLEDVTEYRALERFFKFKKKSLEILEENNNG